MWPCPQSGASDTAWSEVYAQTADAGWTGFTKTTVASMVILLGGAQVALTPEV